MGLAKYGATSYGDTQYGGESEPTINPRTVSKTVNIKTGLTIDEFKKEQ